MSVMDNGEEISKIQKSEERIRTFIENSTEAIWCIDLERPVAIDLPVDEHIDLIYKYAYFTEANDAYAHAAGYERGKAMKGLRLDDVMPRSMPESVATLKELIRVRYRMDDLESTEVSRSGDLYYFLNNLNPIIEDGLLLRVWGTSRDITQIKKSERREQKAKAEILELKKRLEEECTYLQEQIQSEHNFENIIGNSDALKYVLYRVNEVAPTDAPVLIMGETGTGKELIARAIHHASARSQRSLVKVNCAALPGSLIESEMFGHEKGAFTGADSRRIGRFQLADGATLFLDEISEIPYELQAKLLRVLQDGEFEPLGSSKTIRTDVRIIATTNRNMEEAVKNGRFRQDLMYRINVFPLTVPPLRARKEDIPLLVNWLVNKFNRKMGKSITNIPANLFKHLQAFDWPGNIRELENVIERAVITSKKSVLKLADKMSASNQGTNGNRVSRKLADVEKAHIASVLEETHWKIEGKQGAARVLGLAPSTLRDRLKKMGLRRSDSSI